MLRLEKVNKEKVKPIPIKKIDDKNIKGVNILPLYSNSFLLAKKASGKTTVLNHILKNTTNKLTKIFFFVSTIFKDASYKEILKMLDKKGVQYDVFLNIEENGINHLDDIIQVLETQVDNSSSDSSDEDDEFIEYKRKILNFGDSSDEEMEDIQEYKPKKVCAEYIFVFDDMSNQLRNPSVGYLLKKNRHFKSKTIISSQYLHDVKPEVLMNLDIMLLFGGLPDDKLKIVHKSLDLAVDYNLFKDMYLESTIQKYHFLKINIRDELYYKDFNKRFIIE